MYTEFWSLFVSKGMGFFSLCGQSSNRFFIASSIFTMPAQIFCDAFTQSHIPSHGGKKNIGGSITLRSQPWQVNAPWSHSGGPTCDLLRKDHGGAVEICWNIGFWVAMPVIFIRWALVQLPCHGYACTAGTLNLIANFDVQSRVGPPDWLLSHSGMHLPIIFLPSCSQSYNNPCCC